MNFLDQAKWRYTTKKYIPQKKILDTKIEQLKEIVRLSPSSINSQPWKFYFVSDEKIKQELASVSFFNEQKIKEASHLIVFSVIDSVKKFEEQIHQNLPEGAVNYYNNFIRPLPKAEIESWLKQQVYLSLGFFLAACANLEIDSSPMEGLKTEEYDKVLNLNGYKTLFAVAIGYRNSEDANQPSLKAKSRLPIQNVVISI